MRGAVVFFAGLLAVGSTQSTGISQCINNGGDMPINAYVEGCITPPCLLPQLQDVVIRIVFRAPYTMHTMTTLATAYMTVIGIPVPIPYPLGENAVTCNFFDNSYCPVVRDEILMYTLRMHIESFMAENTAVTIEFRIVDDNGEPVLCLRLPIRITAPINPSVAGSLALVEDDRPAPLE